MIDWKNNLPPGCKHSDYDPEMVECNNSNCVRGQVFVRMESNSDGDSVAIYKDCPRCGGTGEVRKGSQ